MKGKPIISVLMSVYKEKPEWLEESINSVLNQTFENFEFIIVNDNPDGIEQKRVLDKYQKLDSRIVLISNSYNLGLPKSLNIGLEKVRGKYVARMDADDISLPNRFKLQYDFLENNLDYGICGTYARYMNEKSKVGLKVRLGYTDKKLKARLLFYTPFMHPSVMVRSGIICQLKYDEYFRVAQDIDLWLRMSKETKFYNIPTVLLYYRIHEQNSNKREKKKLQNDILKKIASERFDYIIDSINFLEKKDIFVRFLTLEMVPNEKLDKKIVDELFLFLLNFCTDKKFYDVLLQRYLYYVMKHGLLYALFFNPFAMNSFWKYIYSIFVYLLGTLKRE